MIWVIVLLLNTLPTLFITYTISSTPLEKEETKLYINRNWIVYMCSQKKECIVSDKVFLYDKIVYLMDPFLGFYINSIDSTYIVKTIRPNFSNWAETSDQIVEINQREIKNIDFQGIPCTIVEECYSPYIEFSEGYRPNGNRFEKIYIDYIFSERFIENSNLDLIEFCSWDKTCNRKKIYLNYESVFLSSIRKNSEYRRTYIAAEKIIEMNVDLNDLIDIDFLKKIN